MPTRRTGPEATFNVLPATGFQRREHLFWGGLRVATGLLFIGAGLAKLLAPAATAEVVRAHHIFSPGTVGTAAGLFEIACGLLLVAASYTRWVAMALGVFVGLAVTLFHLPVTLAGPGALELGFDIGVIALLCALFVHARPKSGT